MSLLPMLMYIRSTTPEMILCTSQLQRLTPSKESVSRWHTSNRNRLCYNLFNLEVQLLTSFYFHFCLHRKPWRESFLITRETFSQWSSRANVSSLPHTETLSEHLVSQRVSYIILTDILLNLLLEVYNHLISFNYFALLQWSSWITFPRTRSPN